MIKLLDAIKRHWPNSFVNSCNELILVPETNLYFRLEDVRNEDEFKCKLLERVSRACFKSQPFDSDRKNARYHRNNLISLNAVLGTSFDADDMELIYTYLGNNVNRALCTRFVVCNYDMEILREKERKDA